MESKQLEGDRQSDDGSASDWSSSGDEDAVVSPAKHTVVYKGISYVGTAAACDNSVPSDVVSLLIAGKSGKSAKALWCRDPGNGALVPLSRSECRKLATDVIGKSAKADTPSRADVVACGLMFGTPFPLQMNVSEKVPKQAASLDAVTFKYSKQTIVGTLVDGKESVLPDGVVGVDVAGAVYWLSGVLTDGAKVALTVTEARKAFRHVVGRQLVADGPTDEDNQDCIEACGLKCPAQLYDAKARNDRAKAKRTTKGVKEKTEAVEAVEINDAVTTVKVEESDAAQSSDVPVAKRRCDDELTSGAKRVRAQEIPTGTTVTVTFSGDVATLLPYLSQALA